MNAPHLPPRRGIAMMLVLISLMMGTVLAVSFLSSNDNSAAIGDNIEAAEEARWTALTGIKIAQAILETEIDWRTLHTGGTLLSNYAIGNGTITIDLVDIETGLPPTAGSRLIQTIITSTVGGIEQIAVATTTVGTDTTVVDLDLSEFAVFTSQGILMNNNAVITRWTAAPASGMGKRIAIGTQSTAAMTVDLNLASAAIDTTLYHGPSASASLVTNAGGPVIEQIGLLDQIPLPASPTPSTAPPPTPSLAPNLSANNATLINTSARYGTIDMGTINGVITLQGNVTLTADALLKFKRDSGMIINGNANVVVYGNLQMDRDSYIELAPSATLHLFVAGNVTMSDAYIGEARADRTVFDNSGMSPAIDLNRIMLYDIDDGLGTPKSWSLSRKSIVKGQVYAPTAAVTLQDHAALYGRVATMVLGMAGNSTLFYDPSLNTGNGYTDPYSPIFDLNGRITADIYSLNSLDTSQFQVLADTMTWTISYGDYFTNYTGYVAPVPVAPLPGDPTPRSVTVENQLLTFGSNINTWESGKIPVKTATVTKFLRVQ